MDEATRKMHLRAGEAYGRTATCRGLSRSGQKVDHRTEETANRIAAALSSPIKTLEAYPCFWCGGWHIGRALTPEEIAGFTEEN